MGQNPRFGGIERKTSNVYASYRNIGRDCFARSEFGIGARRRAARDQKQRAKRPTNPGARTRFPRTTPTSHAARMSARVAHNLSGQNVLNGRFFGWHYRFGFDWNRELRRQLKFGFGWQERFLRDLRFDGRTLCDRFDLNRRGFYGRNFC